MMATSSPRRADSVTLRIPEFLSGGMRRMAVASRQHIIDIRNRWYKNYRLDNHRRVSYLKYESGPCGPHLPSPRREIYLFEVFTMSRVVLLGLPDDLASSLGWVLRDQAHQVRLARSLQDVRRDEPEVAFISGDGPEFAVQPGFASRSRTPHLPLVVVTRLPENSRWLDALEAGAKDYCGAPFEHAQLQWIMDTVCPRPIAQRAAA